jgi:enoyl-CoA hydratase
VTDLLIQRGGAHAVLTLDRAAKKNALSVDLRNEISDALDKLAPDETIKAVVITGAGDVFSAGFDLKEFPRALEDEAFATELWASSDRYHHAVLRFPVPTIAAVNGPALAGGFDLALLCDIRVASTRAAFAHPEYTFGDVVYGPLHDLVGGAVARDLAFTGRVVDAEEALAMRLVSQVVEPNDLMTVTLGVVARITKAPREILMRTKAKALARAGIAPGTPTLDL